MTEATPDTPAARLHDIDVQIAHAAGVARRERESIELIAVSKTRDADAIRPLLLAGHRVFGENRVQEAAAKWPTLLAEFPDARLHLIGQLQSNKADEAVALFDVIHSLDRSSLANALGKAMRAANKPVPCFIQVNIGDEPQKGGCPVAQLPALIETALSNTIPVIGLMCLPPAQVEPAPFFALLAELAARVGLTELSMGMSDDFASAIMLGATHIRIGTALFGEREAAP
jgi:pyridoxal phosphate enzyme (YggS family)